jgi:hypothetical protein
MKLFIVLITFLSLLTSCGYRFGSSELIKPCQKVQIPYACGDSTGLFTQHLIKAITLYSPLEYSSCEGKYLLEVSLDGYKQKPIGFRYEQSYEGTYGRRLVASETQLTVGAKVTLKNVSNNEVIVPTFCLKESIEFDFEPETSLQNQTNYSMGQLDFENAAIEAAKIPLYRKLSKKIVDYLNAAF